MCSSSDSIKGFKQYKEQLSRWVDHIFVGLYLLARPRRKGMSAEVRTHLEKVKARNLGPRVYASLTHDKPSGQKGHLSNFLGEAKVNIRLLDGSGWRVTA